METIPSRFPPARLLPIVVKMRELLDDEKAWVKGRYASMSNGLSAGILSERAVCFCLAGAAGRVNGRFDIDLETELARHLGSFLGTTPPRDLPAWNDHPDRTHDDILKFLDTTISVLQSQASA